MNLYGEDIIFNVEYYEDSMDRGAWQAIVHGLAKS